MPEIHIPRSTAELRTKIGYEDLNGNGYGYGVGVRVRTETGKDMRWGRTEMEPDADTRGVRTLTGTDTRTDRSDTVMDESGGYSKG